jgi:hypothetical protein
VIRRRYDSTGRGLVGQGTAIRSGQVMNALRCDIELGIDEALPEHEGAFAFEARLDLREEPALQGPCAWERALTYAGGSPNLGQLGAALELNADTGFPNSRLPSQLCC